MRPVWILCSVLALAAMVGGLALIDEPPGLHGRGHPAFETMRQGGDGEARHGEVLWLGWAFGCAIILSFSVFVHFGALQRRGRRTLGRLLKLATVLYLGAWTWVVLAYRASFDLAAPELFFTLPRPTAILIFVFWPISMLFLAFFVLGFERWVLTDDEEARFRALVRRVRERGGD